MGGAAGEPGWLEVTMLAHNGELLDIGDGISNICTVLPACCVPSRKSAITRMAVEVPHEGDHVRGSQTFHGVGQLLPDLLAVGQLSVWVCKWLLPLGRVPVGHVGRDDSKGSWLHGDRAGDHTASIESKVD
jgi:hypothetical protein